MVSWLLIAAVLLHALMMGSLFWGYLDSLFYATDRVSKALDFFSIYEAGHSALLNRSVYFYSYLGGQRAPYYSHYGYVPFFAYGFGVPANALPPWQAYWGWVAFGEVLLILNSYVTWRVAGKSSWGVIGAAMWFAFSPMYVELYQGQFSLLMATSLLWMGIGLLRRREAMAGASWAASLVIKSTSALVAPLLLRIGWWRALVAAIVAVAINIPYFIWRPGDLSLFWHTSILNNSVDHYRAGYSLYVPVNHGLLAFIDSIILAFRSGVPQQVSTVVTIAIVLPSLIVTLLARRPDPLLLFAVWILSFFLFFGWVPEYHSVMLLPVLVLLVAHRPAVRPVVVVAYVLLALPTPYWLMNHVWNTGPSPPPSPVDTLQLSWPKWGVIFYHTAKAVPMLVLWAYLLGVQLREGIGFDEVTHLWRAVRGQRGRASQPEPVVAQDDHP